MKTKSPLVLMEQLIMVVVFALAAALCLRMFVLSDTVSRRSAAVDRAVLEAQSAAEQIKQGTRSHEVNWQRAYDADWHPLPSGENAAYHLRVTREDPGDPLLWRVTVSVFTAEGEELFSIPVSGQIWEEVAGHG